jgi:hypothetical protein
VDRDRRRWNDSAHARRRRGVGARFERWHRDAVRDLAFQHIRHDRGRERSRACQHRCGTLVDATRGGRRRHTARGGHDRCRGCVRRRLPPAAAHNGRRSLVAGCTARGDPHRHRLRRQHERYGGRHQRHHPAHTQRRCELGVRRKRHHRKPLGRGLRARPSARRDRRRGQHAAGHDERRADMDFAHAWGRQSLGRGLPQHARGRGGRRRRSHRDDDRRRPALGRAGCGAAHRSARGLMGGHAVDRRRRRFGTRAREQ